MKKMICLVGCLFAGSANAAVMTLDATNNGNYADDGYHDPGYNGTYTGGGPVHNNNSFYSFDVSSLSSVNTINSASITFYSGNGIYGSTDAFETVQIWDVNTAVGLGSSLAVYNDLMTGVQYGQTDVYASQYDSMPEFSVALSSLSFADILNDSSFSLGAYVSSINAVEDAGLWGSSPILPAAYLTVDYDIAAPVPEPSSITLMSLGLAGLGFANWRRQRKVKVS